MKFARYLLLALACVLVGSQLLTDRIGFLQWVWWIPRVFILSRRWCGVFIIGFLSKVKKIKISKTWKTFCKKITSICCIHCIS